MEYILLMHNNAKQAVPQSSSVDSGQPKDLETVELKSQEPWSSFLSLVRQGGVFSGGSAINRGELIGAADTNLLSEALAGHMRFNTNGIADGLQVIHQLLKVHPTVQNGSTVELCETPRTG